MAAFINILSAPFDRYRAIHWYGQPVYSIYPRLRSFLAIHLGENYAGLLAQPKLQEAAQDPARINWLTDKVTNRAQSIASMDDTAEGKARELLEDKVFTVLDYAANLMESENSEDNKWGQLITKAFSIPDYHHVFVENDTVVLAGWGFELMPPVQDNLFSKYHRRARAFDKPDGLRDNPPLKSSTKPPTPEDLPDQQDLPLDDIFDFAPRDEHETQKPEGEPEEIDNQNPPPDGPQDGLTDDDPVQPEPTDEMRPAPQPGIDGDEQGDKLDQDQPATDDGAADALQPGNDLPPFDPDPNKDQDPAQNEPTEPDKDGGDSRASDPEHDADPDAAQGSDPSAVGNAPTQPPVTTFFFGLGLKWFLFWSLILLIVVILFLLLFRNCGGGGGNGPQPVLPTEPGVIVPIDSNYVVKDPDSVRTIVSNRLNIALTGPNKNIQAFASAFKKAYPDGSYQIIYYDTLTFRLQVQVPDSLREFLIADIPEKLKEFNMLVWHESLFERYKTPNDPGFGDAEKDWYIKKVKATGAWETTYGKAELVVAVIDDGFDLSHPELQGKVYKPWNVCERTTDVMTNPNSIHGSHVAGTAIGARDNNNGTCGIAPDCKFMPIQVGDRNGMITSTAIIDAILYAIHQGASVINLSLGMSVGDIVKTYPLNIQQDIIANSFKGEAVFWDQVFELADSKNVTLVLAGGNQGILIGIDPMQRNPLGIKVSATDINNNRANFSNFGPYSTISAPGAHIYNSLPGNRFGYLDGTSMAAPIVTGGVALIKSMNPDISNKDLIKLIQTTGLPFGASGKKVGNLLQLDKALKSAPNDTGEGEEEPECPDILKKIDSLKAEIERLKELCPDGMGAVDTMKMPMGDDLSFCAGRWRSTTYIHNNDGEQVTIYFDFDPDGSGKLTLLEPNKTQCTADLAFSMKSNILNITQRDRAVCNPPPKAYNAYQFSCQPDENGFAACVAQNKTIKANRFSFKLVKTKH